MPRHPLHRLLLGAITALLAARPLVSGDDPGLLSPLSHPAGMVLTLGWFVILVGWASWRVWTRDGTWRSGGGVDLALIALSGLFLVSSLTAADYKQPAWIISWEWVGYLLAFFLVVQIARSPEENHALLCVLIASAVSLAAQSVYQYAFELPASQARLAADPQGFEKGQARRFSHVETDDALLQERELAIRNHRAAATFDDPANLAGFLTLLFPAVVGLVLWAWRGWGKVARAAGLGLCALMTLGIVFTGNWAAILSLVLAALVCCWILPLTWRQRAQVAVCCAAVVVAVFVAFPIGKEIAARSALWQATWKTTEDYPGLGVGAGNLGRQLALAGFRPSNETPYSEVPRNVILEILASAGVAAVVCFGFAVALVAWRVRRSVLAQAGSDKGTRGQGDKGKEWRGSSDFDKDKHLVADRPLDVGRAQRWEFPLGAMVGLLLAFLLRVPNLSAEGILREGWQCGVRSLVWFAVFALCYSGACTQRVVHIVSAAGLLATSLYLVTDGSMSNPCLGQAFWVVAAITLNTLPSPLPARNWSGWARVQLPLALTLGVAAVYFVFVFLPPVQSSLFVADARRHYAAFETIAEPIWQKDPADSGSAAKSHAEVDHARMYLSKHILEPLRSAGRADPDDAYISAELAYWLRQEWNLLFRTTPKVDDAKIVLNQALEATGSPMGGPAAADGAQQVDPRGKEGYLAEFHLHRHVTLALLTSAAKAERNAEQFRKEARKANDGATKKRLLDQVDQSTAHSNDDRRLARQEFDRAVAALDRMLTLHREENERAGRLITELRRQMNQTMTAAKR